MGRIYKEEDSEEQEIEANVLTINEALQEIRVVHNFYEATSENVQLICDLEIIERDLQMSSIPILCVLHFVLL